MRISDWSSDVCSSDLKARRHGITISTVAVEVQRSATILGEIPWINDRDGNLCSIARNDVQTLGRIARGVITRWNFLDLQDLQRPRRQIIVIDRVRGDHRFIADAQLRRSEEHTSELQSLLRTSYDVFCLKKQKTNT